MEENKELSISAKCGHCSNRAPMEIVAKYSHIFETHEDKSSGYVWELYNCYELLICPACNKSILRFYEWNDSMESGDESYTVLFPIDNKLPIGLPERIEKAYNAAINVRNIDVNAYAVLIGRVLEMVCLDRKAKGRTLNDQLKDLSEKGEIPIKLVGIASSLRQLRNIGAHAMLGELTFDEAPILDDLSKAILEYVYSAPYLLKKTEDKLESLKKRKK